MKDGGSFFFTAPSLAPPVDSEYDGRLKSRVSKLDPPPKVGAPIDTVRDDWVITF